MKPPRARLTRREAALIAAALLLPIPLFAQSGLSVPLPDTVSRGLGSIVTVDASDERSGTAATGNASENGSSTQRSEGHAPDQARLAQDISPPRRGATGHGRAVTDRVPDQPAGDSGSGGGNTPAGGEPGGDGGNAGSPGNPDTDAGAGSGSGSSSGGKGSGGGPGGGSGGGGSTDPGIRIDVAGQGSSAGASAGTDSDSGVDVTSGKEGTPSDETGTVEAETTETDGSSTGVVVTVPGIGTGGLPTHKTIP